MEYTMTTLLPLVFLVYLLISDIMFKRKSINIDGHPPIDPRLFYLSKYLVIPVWAGMSLQSWGLGFQVFESYVPLRWVSLGLWSVGFILLFLGRIKLGRDFRLGSPNEATALRLNGLYKFSRHPMYVGLYATIIASILYTQNPVILTLGFFILIVHHQIILAEERWLLGTFGQEYEQYCRKVRRYI